ncbi:hypothetical protein Tco_1197599 [Tanacetum coccineum]
MRSWPWKRQRPQYQRFLSVKKADRRSCGLEEVGPSGKGYLPEQPRTKKSQGRTIVKVTNMIRGGENHKRPFEGDRSGLTDELAFPAIPRNRLMDETIILEGMIEDHQEEQKGTNGDCDSKILFPYNVIIGSTRMRNLRATAEKGVRFMEGGAVHQRKEQMSRIREQALLRTKSSSGHGPNQDVLRENIEEGTIKKVRHPEWVTNTIPVKLANGTWKVQVDYSSLNKVYAKDMYLFPGEGEELASLMEYP